MAKIRILTDVNILGTVVLRKGQIIEASGYGSDFMIGEKSKIIINRSEAEWVNE